MRERVSGDAGEQRIRRAAMDATTCVRVRQAVSLALDGELPPSDVADVASHLLGCESCCRFAVVAAELTQSLRAAAFVLPGGPRTITTSIGEQS